MTLDTLPAHHGGAKHFGALILARALLTGHWQPGGYVFPEELDIGKHFAVSRNQVRNALASLTAAGLIAHGGPGHAGS